MNLIPILIASIFTLTLGGCSSSDSPPAQGNLSVSISDSPMSDVSHVRLVLDEIVMTDFEGTEHHFSLDGMAFNLMDYRGMNSFPVLNNLSLSPGAYHDVYMTLREQQGNEGSWIENMNGRFDLMVDDGRLPLENFNIVADEDFHMTMEIDLFLSLVEHDNYFQLHHEGIYSVDNRRMGHLIGEVDPDWIIDCEVENAYLSLGDGSFRHMAYLYGTNTTSLVHMGDISSARVDQLMTPIAVSPIEQDNEGNYHYQIGYLPTGDYLMGYSCLGHLDDPQNDDINNGQFSLYYFSGSITIESGTMGGSQNVHHMGEGHGGHGG